MAYTEVTNLANPTRITGLDRITFDDPRESFWIGAIRFNRRGTDELVKWAALGTPVKVNGVFIDARVVGAAPTVDIFNPTIATLNDSFPDGMFYLREKVNGAHEITIDPVNFVTKADGLWEYLPYRYRDGSTQIYTNFHGMYVNGHDDVVLIGRGTVAGGDVRPIFAHMIPNNAAILQETISPLAAIAIDNGAGSIATFAIRGVRSIALYNGSVCYGGFKRWDSTKINPVVENFDHWMVFSDVIGSQYSAYNVDSSSAVQVGADSSEPVIKVVINSVITDSMGVKGNLLIFTPRKVVFFDGMPPIPDDTLDSTFVSTLPPSPVGTWAQRAVVRTPYGAVFLGVDGVVYIVPPTGWPVPIGRALERHFRKLNPFQQGRACAEFTNGHYVLTIPRPSGGRLNLTQMETWFVDMRQFNLSKFDAGCVWVGPHDWAPVSVYATGRGRGDELQVMAGSATSGQLFEVWREDVYTNAPVRTDSPSWFSRILALNTQKDIRIHAVSNPLDLGDVHQDKIFDDIQVMLGTNNKSDFTVAVSAIAVSNQTNALDVNHQEFTQTVQSTLGILGGTTLILPPDEATEPLSKQPSSRMVGRMFVLEIKEQAAADADDETKPFIEDISFGVRDVPRRS